MSCDGNNLGVKHNKTQHLFPVLIQCSYWSVPVALLSLVRRSVPATLCCGHHVVQLGGIHGQVLLPLGKVGVMQ